MPRMGAAIYAAHVDSVLKLAKKKGGVSRLQIVGALNVSKPLATKLIERAGLEMIEKVGRTEFFAPPEEAAAAPPQEIKKQSRPPAVEEMVVPVSSAAKAVDTLSVIAELDAKILDVRSSMMSAAARVGKAAGEWAEHQAIVNAMQETMAQLIQKRLSFL